MPLPEFFLSGVRIHAIRVADVVATVDDWIASRRVEYVVLTGAHGVVEMQSDAELRAINNRAGLTTPDGMSVVWMGRLKGHAAIEKVYAPDIMTALFEHGVSRGYRHFLYGGDPGVAEALRAVLERRYPGIHVTGTYCPPFRPLEGHEVDDIAAAIEAAAPDIVWVGIGCPKQERWMARFRPLLQAPVLIGVGAGFDFLAGRKPLAPRWIQRSGFEWLYRLLSEPRRLWPRYSRVVPRFLYIAVRDRLGVQDARRVGAR
ncbi:MAG TPA: WecB/TagA/CpsF family glycosyltransferase [Vicinamibacterales bacterium]|nr:WecB/TagA/CpsF family glycosyltransferase [Vicinamibacterales bacterium]